MESVEICTFFNIITFFKLAKDIFCKHDILHTAVSYNCTNSDIALSDYYFLIDDTQFTQTYHKILGIQERPLLNLLSWSNQ
jgi:hypothetical protein